MEYTVYKHTCPNGKIYKGKKASTETKQKMSEKRKGIKFTDAHRAALRDAALQREEKRRQARCLTIEK